MEDRMFQIFAGEYVVVDIRRPRSHDPIAGFLLDECPNYIYLGAEDREIVAAIAKREIVSILSKHPAEFGDFDTMGDVQ